MPTECSAEECGSGEVSGRVVVAGFDGGAITSDAGAPPCREPAGIEALFMQILVWFEPVFGWVASLILVAVLSGLAKKDE